MWRSPDAPFDDSDCLTILAATYKRILNQISEIGRSTSKSQRRRSEPEITSIAKHLKTGSEELRYFESKAPFSSTDRDARGENQSNFVFDINF
jgi:hypothetical protein